MSTDETTVETTANTAVNTDTSSKKVPKKRLVDLPKGVRDFHHDEVRVRERMFKIIEDIYKLHGAVTLETPVFELRETLLGKYGEDEKLVYELNDQGGAALALRYDLTVPTMRYFSMNNLKSLKRYQIGRVYRRDDPSIAQGRMREFFQCDFDIITPSTTRLPDAECLNMIGEILKALNIGEFTINVSHRELLDGILIYSGVPEDKIRTICSSVDKLDKTPWERVREEMIQKGITAESADKIGKYVQINGKPDQTLAELIARPEWAPDQNQAGCERVRNGLADLKAIFDLLRVMGGLEYITLNCALCRGLDYYDGLVMEAVMVDKTLLSSSISGGGRYNKLSGMFMNGEHVPAVGFTIGVERIFAVYMKQHETNKEKFPQSTVHVVFKQESCIPTCLEVVSSLRKKGVVADHAYSPYLKGNTLGKQLTTCDDRGIPFVVILGHNGEHDIALKNMKTKTQVSCGTVDELMQKLEEGLKML